MNPTIWLTNGSNAFEVANGSPLEKKLLSEGYEQCAPPIPGAPGKPDGSATLGGGDLATEAAPEPDLVEHPAQTEKAKGK